MSLPLLQNFINGRFVPAATDTTVEIVDPRTEQTVAQCPVSGPADVDAAYDAALKAFESWRLTTPAERQTLLLRLADAWRPMPTASSRPSAATPVSSPRWSDRRKC